ncbi:MAG: aromatic ring-hydroxylating dioxygenase subunit alpha [Bacteroidia bacterium]|nr:aromatic ring-hydroxylating dioxygenase subunit alpha [Bacteroidia bacterium]
MPQFQIHPDITEAQTLPTDFYTSPDYFKKAESKIFEHAWHFLSDTGNLNEKVNAYPFILMPGFLNEPLVLTKDKNNQIHCLSNVCTHRGNLIAYQPCKAHVLVCKYHGRRFSLDGTFEFMPEFKEVKNFPSPSDHLHKLTLKKWGNFLFTSLTENIPFEKMYGEMISRMEWYPIDKLTFRPDLSREYQVNAHWALYCENYLEGFHIPFVHPGLNQVLDFSNYTTEIFRYSNVQIGIAKENEIFLEIPPTSPDHGKKIAAYYFWVFPNQMFNFYPWGISVNVVEPLTISKTKVRFLTYVFDESKLQSGAGKDLHKVEMEDEEVVENVQIGIRSRFYRHGRFSASREQGTHHFHQLLAEFMNQ